MKIGFFPKLAATGIRKNSKTYVPYILTCIGSVMMYYIIYSLATEEQLANISGGAVTQSVLMLGSVIMAIFSVIFLFYTNSFLIKRRKKELGLYNVLGMEKRHIIRVLFFESLYIAVISLVLGIISGIIFSKLIKIVLLRLLGYTVAFGFSVSFRVILTVCVTFGIIFLLNLFFNSVRVGKSKPIELLHGGSVGEREPKTNIPLALFGLITLGAGYYMAISAKDPISALLQFFIAVILVIIGTYALITAGSTVVLKLMKKNKRFYYNKKHFISVSGMLYRMKQNAAGISSICILSTMVLVTVSTTFCLYFGIGDLVSKSMKSDCIVRSMSVDEEDVAWVRDEVNSALKGAAVKDYSYADMQAYSYSGNGNDGTFVKNDGYDLSNLRLIYITCPALMSDSNIKLNPGEVIFDSVDNLNFDEITVEGIKYKNLTGDYDYDYSSLISADLSLSSVLIVPDISDIEKILSKDVVENYPKNYYGSIITEDTEALTVASDKINEASRLSEDHSTTSSQTKADITFMFRSNYGTFLFLGIFLGIVFLMATVLIMYYKQISEGYDDAERFRIMENVGMTAKEIRGTIRSQVLMIFFIPLLVAIVHICFAFNMIRAILLAFGLTDPMVFVFYTVGSVLVFAAIYVLMYILTARTYYKIVK